MTFLTHFHVVYSFLKEGRHMNQNTERQRKKYMDHPPEEMTSEDIRHTSEDALLNMDYFFSNALLSNIRLENIRFFLLFRKSEFPIK